MEEQLPEWVKPGASYYVGTGLHPRLFHIRAIVDGQAVVREWWPTKQRWNYTVEHPYWFQSSAVKQR